MMNRVRLLGACLVVAAMLGALAAASAMANMPSFKSCVKAAKVEGKYTGKYNDKGCAEVNGTGEGKYELTEVAPGTTFAGKGKTTTLSAHGVSGATENIVCKKAVVAGQITGENSFNETLTYSKCEANGNKAEQCSNSPAGITTEVSGAAYYINAGETTVGTVTNAPAATFTCGSESVEVKNFLISTIENTAKGFNVVDSLAGAEQADREFFVEGSEVGGTYMHLSTEVEGEFVEATLAGQEEIKAKGLSLR